MVYNVDSILYNADWVKKRWSYPPYKSAKFMLHLEKSGMTLEQFKQLPPYKWAVESGLIIDDKVALLPKSE
jgi:hypothetical protein